MSALVQLCWALLALIHIMPALALFRPALLTTMYGVDAGGATYLLLHHRAALFLGVVVLCIWASFDAGARSVAVVVTAISMIGFLLLYGQGGSPPALRTIAVVDMIGLVPLAVVAWAAIKP
ncbi:MAG: hypothetical protein HC788_16125 [Sphingopyxis sp.]|nr:hypothetical protein [Sphingopyxis sp.]